MLLAKALRIGSLSEWPACLKLCGILPDKTVRVSGMGEDARWRKRCLELGCRGTDANARWRMWTTILRRSLARGSRRDMGGARHTPLGALYLQTA